MDKWRRVVLFSLVVVCGCAASQKEPASGAAMEVSSTSFKPGQSMDVKYTSYGANVSPELSWKGAPTGTKSFVLLVEDPDAPTPQPFVHWLAFNIPATTTEIEEGKQSAGAGGQNGTGTSTYFGPKPPSGTHPLSL